MVMQANKDFMRLSKKYVFCGFLIQLLQVVMAEVLFSVSLVKLKRVIFIWRVSHSLEKLKRNVDMSQK